MLKLVYFLMPYSGRKLNKLYNIRNYPETKSEYFTVWDGNLQSLLAIDKVTLADYQPLAAENDKVLYKGRFDTPGHVCFYFGYRLPDGTLVFNGEQTINVRIKP